MNAPAITKKPASTMVIVSQAGTPLRRSQLSTGLRPMTTNRATKHRIEDDSRVAHAGDHDHCAGKAKEQRGGVVAEVGAALSMLAASPTPVVAASLVVGSAAFAAAFAAAFGGSGDDASVWLIWSAPCPV